MTRIKTIAISLLAWIIVLAALGLFASVGLVVLGILALLGLTLAVAAWISTAFSDDARANDTSY